MNLLNTTSENQRHLASRILLLRRAKKFGLIISLTVFSCLTFSSVWASDRVDAKATSSGIHLTGLSIHISPGGLHIGIGVPSYGRVYGHSHYRPAPRHFWKHSKRHHRRHHHYDSPKRFNRGHGWKKDRHRGYFRGKGSRGGRGNGGHRGGRW